MIISNKYKFVFVHIPRTGGFSVDNAMAKHLGEKDFYTNQYIRPRPPLAQPSGRNYHLKLRNINELDKNKYKNYYKFTFVRNPYERMVSLYSFFSQMNNHKPQNDFESFKDWVTERNNIINPTLRVETQNRWKNVPQLDYLLDKDNNIGVDFVGRTENFADDLTSVVQHLGIPVETIPHKNGSQHLHYSLYYDEETKEKVKKDYIKDLEMFNYDFETNC